MWMLLHSFYSISQYISLMTKIWIELLLIRLNLLDLVPLCPQLNIVERLRHKPRKYFARVWTKKMTTFYSRPSSPLCFTCACLSRCGTIWPDSWCSAVWGEDNIPAPWTWPHSPSSHWHKNNRTRRRETVKKGEHRYSKLHLFKLCDRNNNVNMGS